MTLLTPPPSVLSSSQRRCHLLLMLYLPQQIVTSELISDLNDVSQMQTLQDIADTDHEIQNYHRLTLTQQQDGSYQIEGTVLDRRLCLLHWLRRSLRLCPQFVQHHFSPAMKAQLTQLGLIKALYDDTNLRALINLCGHRLNRPFDSRDSQLLMLFLQYCLHQHHSGATPVLTLKQRQWSQLWPEFVVAQEITRHWKRRVMLPSDIDEQHFLAMLFQLLRIPDPIKDKHQQDARLHNEIAGLIERFRRQAGLAFSDAQGLSHQLYVHLAQALNRCYLGISIDPGLPEEITRLYPGLMRTSREVLRDFEQHYGIQFSDAEMSLVAVIFGAWLMPERDTQEKQVLLLTADDRELERSIEQQLRELTLLPLNITHLAVQQFQCQGAPRDVVLVITPYATSLPLFSPPLIHATQPLGEHQQQRIKALLET